MRSRRDGLWLSRQRAERGKKRRTDRTPKQLINSDKKPQKVLAAGEYHMRRILNPRTIKSSKSGRPL
jgi:hypothetical protein